MFTRRDLPSDLDALRSAHAEDAYILNCDREFETMPSDWVYDLALITDDVTPLGHPDSWIPSDVPASIQRLRGRDLAIGMPTDGSVAWTRQTDPPAIFVKPRAAGIPDDFRDFLIAEAIVEVGMEVPETPLCFFEGEYGAVHDHVGDPQEAFQIAAALRVAWIGLHARERFRGWTETYPRLGEAWADAGARLESRVTELDTLVGANRMSMANATELACSALKHDISLPAPFDALDVDAFADQGAPFARRWVERTV